VASVITHNRLLAIDKDLKALADRGVDITHGCRLHQWRLVDEAQISFFQPAFAEPICAAIWPTSAVAIRKASDPAP
jgi:hypothetical protein